MIDNLNFKLTKKEEQVLTVLWSTKEPLTVKEICSHAETLNISLNQSTVQATINKLVKYGVLKVHEIKQTSTNFARAFVPAIDPEQYSVIKCKQIFNSVSKHKRASFIAALIQEEELAESDLSELASMIERLKNQ